MKIDFKPLTEIGPVHSRQCHGRFTISLRGQGVTRNLRIAKTGEESTIHGLGQICMHLPLCKNARWVAAPTQWWRGILGVTFTPAQTALFDPKTMPNDHPLV